VRPQRSKGIVGSVADFAPLRAFVAPDKPLLDLVPLGNRIICPRLAGFFSGSKMRLGISASRKAKLENEPSGLLFLWTATLGLLCSFASRQPSMALRAARRGQKTKSFRSEMGKNSPCASCCRTLKVLFTGVAAFWPRFSHCELPNRAPACHAPLGAGRCRLHLYGRNLRRTNRACIAPSSKPAKQRV